MEVMPKTLLRLIRICSWGVGGTGSGLWDFCHRFGGDGKKCRFFDFCACVLVLLGIWCWGVRDYSGTILKRILSCWLVLKPFLSLFW